MFVVAFTVVYRKKALYPIYVFVFIIGLMNGFATWWLPYLYIWTVLWGMTMLLPRNIPEKWKPVVYMAVCAAHGYLYGTLYAPAQAILFGLDFKGMVTWIVAGLPFDLVHGTSNFLCGMLIYPLVQLLQRMEKQSLA
jgi:energy-coupling factor transport system substrate-specific component